MLFVNIVRSGRVWAGVAAIALTGASCTAQQASTPQATACAVGAQVLAPGTAVNVGQGTYIMPALPPSADETVYALTGDQTSHQRQQPEGRWVGGINGRVFIPAAP